MNQGDSALMVRFYEREIEIPHQTEVEGRPIYRMADFVRIEVPGDRLNVIDTIADKGHKMRFPMQWAQYQNDRTTEQVEGTLLRDWPLLNAAQARELNHYKFYTVEQIAGASDQQLAGVSMMVGQSGTSLRDKAKAYIAHAKDSSVVQAQTDALRERDQTIADLKEQVDRLMRMVEQPKRVGRPPKVVETETE